MAMEAKPGNEPSRADTTLFIDGTIESTRNTRNTRNERNTASGPEAGISARARSRTFFDQTKLVVDPNASL